MANESMPWIDDVQLEDVEVKWGFSNFAGKAGDYNTAGDHNFQIIVPEVTARELMDAGWTSVRELPPREDGDAPEYLFKIKISYRYESPKIYFIRGRRKIRVDELDLADIRRGTCERIDVIVTPSRWIKGPRSGVTAYVREMYVTIKSSRFEERYADYEEIRPKYETPNLMENFDDEEAV